MTRSWPAPLILFWRIMIRLRRYFHLRQKFRLSHMFGKRGHPVLFGICSDIGQNIEYPVMLHRGFFIGKVSGAARRRHYPKRRAV